eukprot:NODE_1595_length_1478_cov_31.118964_g1438_i0.p1 GENE.NODE_1595_length_1478_cov_31.118964_g1438_i0~~NODE_1595_length_1478_cov_31.118964_g1438_i0.p1  ORF type:complete len:411 (+),score=53.46 NODE_1595_length_1478_cov_31.118964_g1438_i0:132-1364(+)
MSHATSLIAAMLTYSLFLDMLFAEPSSADGRDSVQLCLQDPSLPCRKSAACPSDIDEACLTIQIPPWTVAFTRIQCCMRCCMQKFVRGREIEKSAKTWIEWGAAVRHKHWVYMHSMMDPESILLGYNELVKFSDMGAIYFQDQPLFHGSQCEVRSGWFATQKYPPVFTFINCILPRLTTRVGVFMMTDRIFPDPKYADKFVPLFNSPNVELFALNPGPSLNSTSSRAVHPIPIGLSTPQKWLDHLDGRELNIMNRPTLLLCSYISPSGGQRREKLRQLELNGFNCSYQRSRRDPYIEKLLTAQFVFSPKGKGSNNYREWEALTAGAIPLVDDVPELRETWEGMPVIVVKDWSVITSEYLIQQRDRLLGQHSQLTVSKAFMPYWLHRLSSMIGTDRTAAHKYGGGCPACSR